MPDDVLELVEYEGLWARIRASPRKRLGLRYSSYRRMMDSHANLGVAPA